MPGEQNQVARTVDAIIDFDRAICDPEHPARVRQEYDSGDPIHWKAAKAMVGPACTPCKDPEWVVKKKNMK